MKKRMQFLPEIRAQILAALVSQGVSGATVTTSLEKWNKGENPNTPWEHGCFAVFKKIQHDVEAGA